ncbi:MAG: LysM peptidoglycan-binding domain-containing protein, partial [Saprospiraceae bacterium]|nr:LysM peptidoglycan-binding domain-containing protein [Saprospiraceae bacterium]
MKHLIIGLLASITLSLGAQSVDPFLLNQDSLFVSFNEQGRKFVQHKLNEGESIESVSEYYGLKKEVLLVFNPELEQVDSLTGKVVSIPIPNRAIYRKKLASIPSADFVPLIYTVKKGDSLYDIAKRKLGLSVKHFMDLNALTSTKLDLGQHLRIGWFDSKGVNVGDRISKKEESEFPESERLEEFYSKGETAAERIEILDQGMAIWHENGDSG